MTTISSSSVKFICNFVFIYSSSRHHATSLGIVGIVRSLAPIPSSRRRGEIRRNGIGEQTKEEERNEPASEWSWRHASLELIGTNGKNDGMPVEGRAANHIFVTDRKLAPFSGRRRRPNGHRGVISLLFSFGRVSFLVAILLCDCLIIRSICTFAVGGAADLRMGTWCARI